MRYWRDSTVPICWQEPKANPIKHQGLHNKFVNDALQALTFLDVLVVKTILWERNTEKKNMEEPRPWILTQPCGRTVPFGGLVAGAGCASSRLLGDTAPLLHTPWYEFRWNCHCAVATIVFWTSVSSWCGRLQCCCFALGPNPTEATCL